MSDVVIVGILVIGALAHLFAFPMRKVERTLVPWKGDHALQSCGWWRRRGRHRKGRASAGANRAARCAFLHFDDSALVDSKLSRRTDATPDSAQKLQVMNMS